MTYALTVDTLNVNLKGALDPNSPSYLGEPPAEIKPLVDQTREAFSAMATAETAYEKQCTGTATPACDKAVFDWSSAQDDVTAALAGWSPYGA
jgi:hypothetical protein